MHLETRATKNFSYHLFFKQITNFEKLKDVVSSS